MKRLLLVSVCFVLFCGALPALGDYQAWRRHRDSVKTDPSLVAYYTFETFDGMQVKNLAGRHHALTTEDITAVPGRFSEKPAVCIDGGYFISNPGDSKDSFDIRNNSFTFECWLMKQTAGEDGRHGGMIFNCSNGYGNSWRVTTGFPDGPVTLSLGRSREGPATFSTAPVTDNSWHHIAATWDGETVNMYLDGRLSSSQKYAGPYYPDLMKVPSWLGRPGWGIGRARLVIDELAIYGRALAVEEVKERFLLGNGPLSAVPEKEEFPEPEVRVSFPEIPGEYRSVTSAEKAAGGYFPAGANIPVGLVFTRKGKQYTAHFTVLDAANQPVFADKALITSTPGKPLYKDIRVPGRCGIYWLRVALEDKDNRLLCRREFPFGATVKLPDIKDVPDNASLGAQSVCESPESRYYGVKWDRAVYAYKTTWWHIEKTPGTYDWTGADRIVNDVTGGGNAMLFFIHGVPDWAALKSSPVGGPGATYGPKNPEDMKRFVRALVSRYKDRVRYWEVWNEPNHNVFVPGDEPGSDAAAVEYVRILKAVYEAIKETDPGAKVVGINGSPGFLDWTAKVLKAGGGEYLDIIGFHNYVGRNPNQHFSQHRPVEKLKEIIRTYVKRPVPIWDGETTFAAPSRVDGRPMSEEYYFKHSSIAPGADLYIDACYPVVPERRCAAWEIQATLLDFASGVEKRFLNTVRAMNGYAVHERGVALAALARVAGNKKDVRQFSAGTGQVCAVLVTGGDGKRTAALWSVNNRPAVVSLVLPDTAKHYRGMDFWGTPVDFGQANQGLLTLSISPEPLYVFDVPEEVSGAQIMEIKGENIASANVPYSGDIIIRNPLKKTMKAVVRPELPDGWRAEISGEIAVPAGTETSVPFILRAPEKTEGFFPLRFVLMSGQKPVATAESNVLIRVIRDIPRAAGDIVINGDAGKWGRMERFSAVTDTEEQVVIGRRNPLIPVEHPHWEGRDDLSFKVSAAWRERELYVLVEVTDEHLSAAPEGRESAAYLYDCVEIFVDIRESPDDLRIKTAGAVQILVVPALTEEASGCRVAYLGSGVAAKFAGRKTDRGYLVEGRISPAPGSGLTISQGQSIGLDIAVGDASDVPGTRKTQMVLFGSYSNWDNPAFWGRFRLK